MKQDIITCVTQGFGAALMVLGGLIVAIVVSLYISWRKSRVKPRHFDLGR